MTDQSVMQTAEIVSSRQWLQERVKGSRNLLFQGLSEISIQYIFSHSHLYNISAEYQVIEQGDEARYLYLVIAGSIKTSRCGSEGEEATIRLLKSGDSLMDAVIFMGGKSPVNAVAMEDSQLLAIPAEIVRRQALQDPQFACNLLKIVTGYYKSAMQQIENIVAKTPAARLGYYLLKLHIAQGSDSMDIALPFQKSAIANHLGMKPETFSRALGQIKKMGIDVDQSHLKLRDAYVLCHYCDSDTAHECSSHETEKCILSSSYCKGKSCH